MKTKLSILFFFVGIIFFAQTTESMKKGAEKMYEASYNMDFEAILDATYPKIFDMATREQMYDFMDKSFQNEQFRIRFVHPTVNMNYSDIKEVEGKKIVLITYEASMRMIFETQLSDIEIKDMQYNLQTNLSEKKVIYEPSRNGFLITGTDTMIAIADQHTNQEWKYITYDKVQKPLLIQIIGENVLQKLGL